MSENHPDLRTASVCGIPETRTDDRSQHVLNCDPRKKNDLVRCVAFYTINHVLADTGIFRFKMDASTRTIEKCGGVGVEARVAVRLATGELSCQP